MLSLIRINILPQIFPFFFLRQSPPLRHVCDYQLQGILPKMDSRILYTGVAVLEVIIWYLACRFKQVRARPSPQPVSKHVLTFSDPVSCAGILGCKGYSSTGAKNLYSDVKSRAIPNERLTRAFVIDNSFTTSEAERRREFNLEAAKAIKMTELKVRNIMSKKPLLSQRGCIRMSRA